MSVCVFETILDMYTLLWNSNMKLHNSKSYNGLCYGAITNKLEFLIGHISCSKLFLNTLLCTA